MVDWVTAIILVCGFSVVSFLLAAILNHVRGLSGDLYKLQTELIEVNEHLKATFSEYDAITTHLHNIVEAIDPEWHAKQSRQLQNNLRSMAQDLERRVREPPEG